ncbi:MAG: hypothetical protein Q7K57_55765 [Burkholderiaceae bacterium]|nr:hypothetical protein [Burkholderiaceae bacterium]
MNLAYELLNASREELIAYLRSWDVAYGDHEPDIVLRLMAQRNFQAEGPGAGPVPASVGSNPGCQEERDHVVTPIRP